MLEKPITHYGCAIYASQLTFPNGTNSTVGFLAAQADLIQRNPQPSFV